MRRSRQAKGGPFRLDLAAKAGEGGKVFAQVALSVLGQQRKGVLKERKVVSEGLRAGRDWRSEGAPPGPGSFGLLQGLDVLGWPGQGVALRVCLLLKCLLPAVLLE